jgi:hypothetical protein
MMKRTDPSPICPSCNAEIDTDLEFALTCDRCGKEVCAKCSVPVEDGAEHYCRQSCYREELGHPPPLPQHCDSTALQEARKRGEDPRTVTVTAQELQALHSYKDRWETIGKIRCTWYHDGDCDDDAYVSCMHRECGSVDILRDEYAEHCPYCGDQIRVATMDDLRDKWRDDYHEAKGDREREEREER